MTGRTRETQDFDLASYRCTYGSVGHTGGSNIIRDRLLDAAAVCGYLVMTISLGYCAAGLAHWLVRL